MKGVAQTSPFTTDPSQNNPWTALGHHSQLGTLRCFWVKWLVQSHIKSSHMHLLSPFVWSTWNNRLEKLPDPTVSKPKILGPADLLSIMLCNPCVFFVYLSYAQIHKTLKV